ncbi:MAG: OmpA family protein [Saprospiraceae bacterium]|nr:OmpA family protein [Saprospiraceae bacterium]
MNTIPNLKRFLAFPLLLSAVCLNAQNEIKYTETDEKYGNTTVVYTDGKNADDAAILSQLDDTYGIGDVIRITTAPPPSRAKEMVASTDDAMMFIEPRQTRTAAPQVVSKAPRHVQTVQKKAAEPEVAMKKAVVVREEKTAPKTARRNIVFRLEKLYFDANEYEIKTESKEELDQLLVFMEENPEAKIEVRGHTNNLMWPNADYAYELSTNRAKAVADWLIENGVAADRVQYKGYGWTMPILPNINEEGRRKNQRVEVKVLNM